jgi:hypothetical protein
MQGFNNILQSCMEQQSLQMSGDFLSQLLGNANSRAQPSFLGNANPRAEPSIMDYLQQSSGLPTSIATTLGASLVPKFLDPVGTMHRLPPLAETPPYDDMLSRGGTPMGHDANPFSSFMPCSPSFIPPTSGLDSGYSSYTQGSAQTMMDLDRMSRRSSGVSEDSSASQLRAFLAQQSTYDSPMQLNQFQPGKRYPQDCCTVCKERTFGVTDPAMVFRVWLLIVFPPTALMWSALFCCCGLPDVLPLT